MIDVAAPPKYVKEVLKTLEQREHSAYLVGGCVRDMLMGKRPSDWDVCTSATPDEVIALFEKTVPTGLRHGTVTVIMSGGRKVEVTTLRREEGYGDHRRPDGVTYISSLNEDLSRRDFTMNAIAVPLGGICIDPYGGIGDIEKRRIRCVGDPEKRFSEDALRMLRGLRFAAKLNFTLDPDVEVAIAKCAHLTRDLAAERVCSELDKILRSRNSQVMGEVIRFGLFDAYLERRPDINLDVLRSVPRNKAQQWAALSALLMRAEAIRSVPDFLKKLRLDGETMGAAAKGVGLALAGAPEDQYSWKVVLAKNGITTAQCAAAAADVLANGGGYQELLRAVMKSGECFSLKKLAVDGNDLIALGYSPGIQVGQTLEELLRHVMAHPEENKRDVLIARAVEISRSLRCR